MNRAVGGRAAARAGGPTARIVLRHALVAAAVEPGLAGRGTAARDAQGIGVLRHGAGHAIGATARRGLGLAAGAAANGARRTHRTANAVTTGTKGVVAHGRAVRAVRPTRVDVFGDATCKFLADVKARRADGSTDAIDAGGHESRGASSGAVGARGAARVDAGVRNAARGARVKAGRALHSADSGDAGGFGVLEGGAGRAARAARHRRIVANARAATMMSAEGADASVVLCVADFTAATGRVAATGGTAAAVTRERKDLTDTGRADLGSSAGVTARAAVHRVGARVDATLEAAGTGRAVGARRAGGDREAQRDGEQPDAVEASRRFATSPAGLAFVSLATQ